MSSLSGVLSLAILVGGRRLFNALSEVGSCYRSGLIRESLLLGFHLSLFHFVMRVFFKELVQRARIAGHRTRKTLISSDDFFSNGLRLRGVNGGLSSCDRMSFQISHNRGDNFLLSAQTCCNHRNFYFIA